MNPYLQLRKASPPRIPTARRMNMFLGFALSALLAVPTIGAAQRVSNNDAGVVSLKPPATNFSRATPRSVIGDVSLTGAEPTMSPRFFRSGTPGDPCSEFSSGNFQFQEVQFFSDATGSLTANFDPGTCGTGVFVTFHTQPFNPGSICDNFVWAFGSSQLFTETFAVPPNTAMTMVVSGVANAPGVVCGPATYQIDGGNQGAVLSLGTVVGADVCTAVPANNNTILEPGEVLNLSVPLAAAGGGFTNVVGTLSSATPGVTIVTSMGAYGDIASGNTGTANYSVALSDTVTCGSSVDLTLNITSNEGNFSYPISRDVGGAAISYAGLPLVIPDNLPAGASSVATVSNAPGPITSVQVRVATTHTWVGDLIYTLTSPGGTTITLLDRPGVPVPNTVGCNNNDVNVTFADGNPDPETICDPAGDAAAWPVTLAAPVDALSALNGQTAVGDWTLTVSDSVAADTGTLTDWELIIQPAPSGTCSVCPSGADVAVTLTNTPDPVNAGAQITYTAVATNNGGSAATDMSVSLPLPTGVSLVSATASGTGTCVGTVCTWTGTTANGASETATIVGLVAADTAAGTVLSATATVDALENDPTAANDTATATATTAALADLTTTLTDTPDPVTAGANVTYTATVANAGPSDAQGVTVALPAPTGTTLVSGTGVIGTIAAGSTGQATFVYTVSPAVLTGTVISATATAATSTPESNAANNSGSTTTAVITSADLRLISLTPSTTSTNVNVPVTFTAVSQNFGISDAQNVVVSIALSPDFRYTSHTATGATCTTPQVGNSGTISCTWAGATAVNATRTLVVTAFSNNNALNTVTASTSSPTPDPIANNNSQAVTVTVGLVIQGIPSLDRTAMLLLGLLLALGGLVAVRRHS